MRSSIIDTNFIVLVLIVNIILGGKRLRDIDYIKGDVLMVRLLGLRSVPDVATISRRLDSMDEDVTKKYREFLKDMKNTRSAG